MSHPHNSSGCCDASDEAVASQLNHFLEEFYGELSKTCIDAQTAWVLPCDLTSDNPDIPREAGESFACYFMRAMEQKLFLANAFKGVETYGFFYALMPPDNPAVIPPGQPIAFPRNGPSKGGVTRLTNGAFILPDVATYDIYYVTIHIVVGPGGSGQTELRLNGVSVANTGDRQFNQVLLTTTTENSVLEVINPTVNTDNLTMLTNVGSGNVPLSAVLSIKKL